MVVDIFSKRRGGKGNGTDHPRSYTWTVAVGEGTENASLREAAQEAMERAGKILGTNSYSDTIRQAIRATLQKGDRQEKKGDKKQPITETLVG